MHLIEAPSAEGAVALATEGVSSSDLTYYSINQNLKEIGEGKGDEVDIYNIQ